jgi:hypothetical protein
LNKFCGYLPTGSSFAFIYFSLVVGYKQLVCGHVFVEELNQTRYFTTAFNVLAVGRCLEGLL